MGENRKKELTPQRSQGGSEDDEEAEAFGRMLRSPPGVGGGGGLGL